MKRKPHSHDDFFASSMEYKQIAKETALYALPKMIADQIDFNTLEIAHDVWVDEQLAVHSADIIYKARVLESRSKVVYILFEHKSKIDSNVQFQNLQYITEIWSEYRKQYPRRKLPQILPIIIYHGSKPWILDNSLKPLCEFLNGAEGSLPEYKNYMIDLSAISMDANSPKAGYLSIMTKAVFSGPEIFKTT